MKHIGLIIFLVSLMAGHILVTHGYYFGMLIVFAGVLTLFVLLIGDSIKTENAIRGRRKARQLQQSYPCPICGHVNYWWAYQCGKCGYLEPTWNQAHTFHPWPLEPKYFRNDVLFTHSMT